MKTAELTDAALDWAVCLIEHPEWKEQGYLEVFPYDLQFDDGTAYSPSTDWAQGGPIIERIEGFELKIWLESNREVKCQAEIHNYGGDYIAFGPTPLIAAMRCYCASKLGDEVEIPEELK